MTVLQPATSRVHTDESGPAPVGLRRGRSVPHLLVGAVLVVVCALAFAVTSLRVDPRTAVLAVAGPVPAGHVLTDADLMVVRIVPDAVLGTVSEAQWSSVVGRAVRLPLAAHSLLSDGVLGPAAWPPAGQSLTAVAVKAGHAPAGVASGARVLVLVVPGSSTTTTGTTVGDLEQAQAVVSAVGVADAAGTTVVSLLMAAPDAVRIADARGDVTLMVLGGVG
jgi:hypothetical protein